eukprot:c8823_g1_i3.p1 GENE.c8823_g1_i3~~c8823_g1_i3.p1  ORF type:complete len:297 (-),score=64.61 c8823_g1_i3:518-1408(-)
MTSIRAVWVLNRSGTVIFSRRFPTVERRVKNCEWYVPLPSDAEISRLFEQEIISNRDNERPESYPVTCLDKGRLWPFALVKRHEVYFLAIPGLDSEQCKVPQYFSTELFIAMPCITATFSLLEDLTDFVTPAIAKAEATLLSEFQSHLSGALPFGTPVETDFTNLRRFQKTGFPQSDQLTVRRPAWKPVFFKGRQKIEIFIREEIRAVQYDSPSFKDVCELFGAVNTRCDMEGHPTISFPLINVTSIENLTVHECVQTTDFPAPSRLDFSPPLDIFCLARYQAKFVVSFAFDLIRC